MSKRIIKVVIFRVNEVASGSRNYSNCHSEKNIEIGIVRQGVEVVYSF